MGEFERGHNSEIMERPTDNAEIPQLMKSLPNLGINNKEKPLCFGYSVKARALLFAHLSRIPLPKHTLHQDRLYIIKKCPYLIHEMVSCLSQLILLAHAGRIARLPSLDTVEATMKCSALVVQAPPLLVQDHRLLHRLLLMSGWVLACLSQYFFPDTASKYHGAQVGSGILFDRCKPRRWAETSERRQADRLSD